MTESMTRVLRWMRNKLRRRKPQWSESQFFTTDEQGRPPVLPAPTKETP